MSFRQAVSELIEDRVRLLTHPVQGYIPAGKIDHKNGVALEVKIPHPHGAVHPGKTVEEKFITLYGVPLPAGQTGFIAALLDWASGGDRAVTVGFKGASMAHPYIVNFLSLAKPVDDAPAETTANRQPVVARRAARAGGAHTGVTSTPAAPTGTNGAALPVLPTPKNPAAAAFDATKAPPAIDGSLSAAAAAAGQANRARAGAVMQRQQANQLQRRG